jgi:hypothetical protein
MVRQYNGSLYGQPIKLHNFAILLIKFKIFIKLICHFPYCLPTFFSIKIAISYNTPPTWFLWSTNKHTFLGFFEKELKLTCTKKKNEKELKWCNKTMSKPERLLLGHKLNTYHLGTHIILKNLNIKWLIIDVTLLFMFKFFSLIWVCPNIIDLGLCL